MQLIFNKILYRFKLNYLTCFEQPKDYFNNNNNNNNNNNIYLIKHSYQQDPFKGAVQSMQYNNTPNNVSVKNTVSDLKDNNYLYVKATLNMYFWNIFEILLAAFSTNLTKWGLQH